MNISLYLVGSWMIEMGVGSKAVIHMLVVCDIRVLEGVRGNSNRNDANACISIAFTAASCAVGEH
jgi:hypothetical protein